MKYDAQYFIDKFTAIPEEKWCVDRYESLEGKHCALGHLGVNNHDPYPPEAEALCRLLPGDVVSINDGDLPSFQQPTPRARILAALEAIKAKEGA